MSATRTSSLCPYCGVGCGLDVTTENGRLRGVAGDPHHPVNRGRTCRKPLELAAAVHADDRATMPLMRGTGDARLRPTAWDHALHSVAATVQRIVAEHGPDALGFYISGQLLTEDYYVIGKLVRGFLHTNNLDSNSRLCMSSAVAGYTGAFGSDGPPPSYADIELADCFLLLGSNTAACHPIVWSRIRDRQREGAGIVCIDPRATPTARAADLHLPVRPGTDLALLNALLHVIEAEGMLDESFVARHTRGFDEAIAVAREWTPQRAAAVCDVEAELIVAAARRFGAARAALALWSMGANQSTVGTLKNRALINLCLAAGHFGRPGAGPLSLTGQPNAMGGREAGGLAQLLPGYRRVDSAEDRAAMEAHWGLPGGALPSTPGLGAVQLFEAAAAGTVRLLWIVATNPVVSMPDSALVRAAMERAELVVVQDAHHPTETSTLADVVLPAAAWPEKQGTMTNSERRVGLVARALASPGEARPDWRIFAGLARALGHGEHFAWRDEAAVYDEFARCTAGRLCDVSSFSHERLRREGAIQWPEGRPRLYEGARVPTPDGRARFAPTPHSEPAEAPDPDYPLLLTTGRVADQWHTMTRTGKSATLRAAAGEPMLELHPDDATAAGIADGDLVVVSSRRGALRLRARVGAGVAPGTAFAPFHWGALHAAPGAGAVNAATHRATDPVSLQPELKALAVRIAPARKRRPVPRGRARPLRVVVVGTGMADLAVVEEAVSRRPRDELSVTMLGEEPALPYNRILVSKLLSGAVGRGELELRPRGWYEAHGADLRRGCAAVALDVDRRAVTGEDGEVHAYDALVLATGSRALVPPIPGAGAPHVHVLRTVADAERLGGACEAVAGSPRAAVVVGGGLLGLEAAAGLHGRGLGVTIVELADRVMPQQLDGPAAAMLAHRLGELGLTLALGRSVAAIEPERVLLDDGAAIPASLVVVAAGVRPEVSLARDAGIGCERGILVDDELRTDVPGVWAVGECAQHRGTVYGLWAPLAEQARVAGARVVGDPAAFRGAVPATTLKVAGVDVFAGGGSGPTEGHDELLVSDTRRRRYRRLLLDGERLTAATLVGDVGDARRLSELLRSGDPVPEALLHGPGPGGAASAVDESPAAIVCSCNAVTRGELTAAIRTGGLTTVAQIGNATRAGTGCGSCTADLVTLLDSSSAGNMGETIPKPRHESMSP